MTRPESVTQSRVVARTVGISLRQVGAHVFLVDGRRDAIHSLDPISGGIWRLLAKPREREEIAAVLADAFPDVPKPRLDRDIARVLNALEAAGLVQVQAPRAAPPAAQKRKRLTRLT